MKKSLLALLFAVALAVPAMAENMWVGGDFSYNNTSPKDGDSVSSFSIEPEFGYSVDDTWDIGIDLGYAYEEGVTDFAGVPVPPEFTPEKVTTIGLAPFVRYKMFEIGDFSFLAKGSIFYASSKLDNADLSFTSYGIRVVPVVTYSINETWSIGATLDFAEIAFETVKSDDSDKADVEDTTFGFKGNSGSIIGVNFSYHF